MKSIDDKISELENQLAEARAEKERIRLENPTTIGARILKTRKLKGITQQEIADNAGVTRQCISALEKEINESISAKVLGGIAKTLGVSCDYLIFGEEYKA